MQMYMMMISRVLFGFTDINKNNLFDRTPFLLNKRKKIIDTILTSRSEPHNIERKLISLPSRLQPDIDTRQSKKIKLISIY